jgi:hypothetical protein
MGIMRSESAALEVIDQLEARADELGIAFSRHLIDIGGEERLCLLGAGLVLVPPRHAEWRLDTYELLFAHAHTLIALARLGLERVNSFEQAPRTAWPPQQCRFCGGGELLVLPRSTSRRGVYEIHCQNCGKDMIELGPPAFRSTPRPPHAS